MTGADTRAGLGLGTECGTPSGRVLLGIEVFSPSGPAGE